MKVRQTALPDVVIVEPDVYHDSRGFFFEAYRRDTYGAHGIMETFVQENHSRSRLGTVRGLHLQVDPHPQAKLVRVLAGEIYDVAVDVRRGSPTFGRWVAVTLSADRFMQFFLPPGFAHGFAVVSDVAEVEYKCSDFYDPASEVGIAWDDPALGIPWPVERPTLSDRDRRHPVLAAVGDRLPRF
jgi:dTDP-4-dehydrorhamnose 3,5-epimerase